jgi:hypothetical protein
MEVTSRLQSSAFPAFQTSVPEFTPVQFCMTPEIAESRGQRRIGVIWAALRGRCNFSLAKVGVEGSNPFARSSFPMVREPPKPAIFAGFVRQAAAGSERSSRPTETSWLPAGYTFDRETQNEVVVSGEFTWIPLRSLATKHENGLPLADALSPNEGDRLSS